MRPPYRLLVITSANQDEDALSAETILSHARQWEAAGVAVEVVVDPPRFSLERLVQGNEFDAVLPIPLFGYGADTAEPAYVVPQVLEQCGAGFIGCPSYVQLLTADKMVSLARSGCGVPGVLVSRAAFDGKGVGDVVAGIAAARFPLFVKPNSLCASRGIDDTSVVATPEEAVRRIQAVFEAFPRLQELRLEPYLGHCRQFTVGVVGNGDRTIASVCEIIFPQDGTRLFSSGRKSTPMAERDVAYEIVADRALRDELAFHGRRVFAHLGMRDYARFDFFLADEVLLHDVNSHPTLGNSLSWEWQKALGLTLSQVFMLPLVAFHFRQLADGKGSRLPPTVLSSMPSQAIAALTGCRPVTAPPELTPPAAECPNPWPYHCVDGMAVETDVLDFLAALVRLIKPLRVVETGTYLGASGEAIARALLDNGCGLLQTIENDPARAQAAASRLAGLPAQVVTSSSLHYVPDGRIDMLFLDSHRPLRGKEFAHFRPYLGPESLIVWHDSAPHHPGVRDAIEALVEANTIDRLHLPTPRGLCLSKLRRALG